MQGPILGRAPKARLLQCGRPKACQSSALESFLGGIPARASCSSADPESFLGQRPRAFWGLRNRKYCTHTHNVYTCTCIYVHPNIYGMHIFQGRVSHLSLFLSGSSSFRSEGSPSTCTGGGSSCERCLKHSHLEGLSQWFFAPSWTAASARGRASWGNWPCKDSSTNNKQCRWRQRMIPSIFMRKNCWRRPVFAAETD